MTNLERALQFADRSLGHAIGPVKITDGIVRDLSAEFDAVAAEAMGERFSGQSPACVHKPTACPDGCTCYCNGCMIERTVAHLAAEKDAHGAALVERDEAIAQRDAFGQKAAQLQYAYVVLDEQCKKLRARVAELELNEHIDRALAR
jgi:hypothetical protein